MSDTPPKATKSSVNWVALIPVGLFAALAGAFLAPGLFRENPDALPSQLAGQQAPAVATEVLADKPLFDDATLRDGEVKLVNFWASWCVPCRAEHPQLEALSKDLPVYAVNYKDRAEDGLAFLTELGDPFAGHVADARGRMAINWGLYGVPETYVIAGDGTIITRYAGPITQSVIDNTIQPAIDAARAR